MSSIRVGFETVSAESNRLADVVDSMQSRVKAAEISVSDLTGAGWSGVAASAFQAAFEDWDAAAEGSVGVLDELVQGLRATVSEFMAREQANAELSHRLRGAVETQPGSLGIAAILGGE